MSYADPIHHSLQDQQVALDAGNTGRQYHAQDLDDIANQVFLRLNCRYSLLCVRQNAQGDPLSEVGNHPD